LNRHIAGFCAAIALLLCGPAQADDLVAIGSQQDYVFGGEDLTGQLAYDVNSATGQYVLCYSVELPTYDRLYCRLFNENGGPASSIVQHDYSNMSDQRISTIDVSLADNGDFYAAVMTRRIGSPFAYLQGWNHQGIPLFPSFNIEGNVDWMDLSVAATPQGPWIGGTIVEGDFGDAHVITRSYNTAGDLIDGATHATFRMHFTSFCLEDDRVADIAANRSGDVAFTWIRPNFNQVCNGTVMTKTLRAGGASSPDRAISAVIRNGAGQDASPNTRPHIAALDNGRFVLNWLDDVANNSVTATINQANAIIVPETDMMAVPEFALVELGANPVNGDFAVGAKDDSSGSCDLRAQLAFEGDVLPQTQFSVGPCFGVMHHEFQFLRDGRLSVARSLFDRVTLSSVVLPALIEVNNVNVSEGNPLPGDPPPGTPPSAAVSVTLTKPHPAGHDVRVSYYTRNGSATAGQDFELTQGEVIFNGAAGETVKTIQLPLKPDTKYEDDEYFTVEFELPVNARIRKGDERATVVIRDDDLTPPIVPCGAGVAPENCLTQTEPTLNNSVEVLVSLTMAQAVDRDVQINYTTQDGTAHAGTDYDARSGSVQIIAGATSAVIPLTILGDATTPNPEDSELFHLRLTAPPRVHLTAADLHIHITDSDVCTLQLSRPSITTSHVAKTETLTVSTRPGCNWTASVRPQDDWIHVSPAGGTGNGSVDLGIDAFTAQPPVYERGGELTVALTDFPFTSLVIPVDQNGACDFTVTEDSQEPTPPATTPVPFDVAGGTGQFTIDATVDECAWTVSSPVPWITILSPTMPAFGDAVVRYRVDENADQVNVGNNDRSVRLDSELFDYTVAQNGCDYALDDATITFDAPGKVSIFVDMTASPICQWTAVSNDSWILVASGASGSGDGEIEVYVVDNPSVTPRSGTVTIGDQTLTVNQQGVQCLYGLTPSTVTACPDGRSFIVDVGATDGCSWTVHKDAPWITLIDGTSGIGGDQTTGIIDLNLSESARVTTLELRAQNNAVATAQLSQEGFLTYEVFDAVRPADWSYLPDAVWTTAAGNLVGQASGQGIATALDQASICSECEVDARVSVNSAASTPGDVLTVVGWYRNANNHVGLAMDEFSNRWTLYQMINGTPVSVTANVDKIIPNLFYDVSLVFDGTTFKAEIGDVPLLQMPLQGEPPRGSAGLRLVNSNGRMSELRISRIKPSEPASDGDQIFKGSFEATEVSNLSQCQLLN
jgi:hypothetical protein